MKRPSMKHKTKQKDPDLDAESAETLIWTCSACGATILTLNNHASPAAEPELETPRPRRPQNQLKEQEPKELEEPEPLEASEPEKIDSEETPPEPAIFSFDTIEKNSEPPLPEPEITPFLPTLLHTPHSANRPPPRRSGMTIPHGFREHSCAVPHQVQGADRI